MERTMSLRQIARELGVSHTLLVLWLQGKRNLAPSLEARYHQLVTSGYTHGCNPHRNSERHTEDSDTRFGDPPGTRTQNLRIKSSPTNVPQCVALSGDVPSRIHSQGAICICCAVLSRPMSPSMSAILSAEIHSWPHWHWEGSTPSSFSALKVEC